nr:hypothetical protein [Halolamina pelagica]
MAGLLGMSAFRAAKPVRRTRMMNRLTEPRPKPPASSIALASGSRRSGHMRAMPEILRDINDATKERATSSARPPCRRSSAPRRLGLAELVSQMSTGELDALLTEIRMPRRKRPMARTMEKHRGDLKALNSACKRSASR